MRASISLILLKIEITLDDASTGRNGENERQQINGNSGGDWWRLRLGKEEQIPYWRGQE
jgi:hypothetical protein